MKTSSIILSLTLAAVSVSAAPRGFGQQGQQGASAKSGANAAKGGAQAASTVAVESNAATAAAASSTNAASNNAGAGAAATAANSTAAAGTADTASNSTASATTDTSSSTGTITATGSLSTDSVTTNATENNPDPQSSLTLDPRVIATGFLNNGQDVQEAGQVASITSNNNFINYCLTQNFPITNGLQITSGSCNPAPIGTIPAVGNMPSCKFANPANGATVPANTEFTISMNIQNIDTGNFVNADENYFAAPQQLNAQGQIIGHTHVVIEAINGLADTTPTNPQTFAFFKGVNTAAVNGAVTADVTSGVPAGTYRLCSINSSSNHQPVIVPVAQHGGLDDCVYFTASDGGAATASNATAATGAAATGANSTAATGAAANSTAATGAGAAVAGTAATGAAAGASGAAAAGTAATAGASGAAAAKAGNGAAAAQPATAQPATAAKAGAAANQAKGGKGKRMMYSRATF